MPYTTTARGGGSVGGTPGEGLSRPSDPADDRGERHDLRAEKRRGNMIGARLSIVAVIALLVVVAGAGAAGNGKSGPTVGDCMSDVLYGNEPNMADGSVGGPAEQEPGTQAGNVVPTQSPGPWVNNPADPENPTRGNSAGQWMQEGVNVPELCRDAVAP